MQEREKEITQPPELKQTDLDQESSVLLVSESHAAEHRDTDAASTLVIRDAAPQIQDPVIGTVVDQRYEILSLKGKGATSSVYKAMDSRLNHPVAIKLLHSHLMSDPDIVRRFEQEARTASLIAHPNCVAIHDCSKTASGQPYFIMDFVDGVSLQQMIQEAGWLPREKAIAIFSQVCAALAAAHEKGIVHRDLKPGNIMVTTSSTGEDLVKVLDFGASKLMPQQGETFFKLTQTGEMIGSVLYMNPEQCLDQDVDARSDIYSLGCSLYEAVTGKAPFCCRTAFETMNKHMTEKPERLNRVRPDLHLPSALEQVIFKALAKEPKNRYQTVTELQDALRGLPAKAEGSNQIEMEAQTSVTTRSNVVAAAEKELAHRTLCSRTLALGGFVIGAVCISVIVLLMGMYHVDLRMWLPSGFCALVITLLSGAMMVLSVAQWIGQSATVRKFKDTVALVSSGTPENMLVTRVDLANEQFQYFLDLAPINAPELTSKRIRVSLPGSRVVISAEEIAQIELWKGLCTASKLDGISHTGVFPLSCQAYIDPQTQEPVAIALRDSLVFVVL